MNRRGAVRLIVGVATLAVAGVVALLKAIPEPEGFWPHTWSGWGLWLGFGSTLSAILYVIFGPFLRERLRKFMELDETLRLLTGIVVTILKTDVVGLVIKDIVTRLFADRIKETADMWEEIDDLSEEVAKMRQSFDETIRPALDRIEASQGRLQEQLTAAARDTAKEIERQVSNAREEFRDHGGRRVNQRGS